MITVVVWWLHSKERASHPAALYCHPGPLQAVQYPLNDKEGRIRGASDSRGRDLEIASSNVLLRGSSIHDSLPYRTRSIQYSFSDPNTKTQGAANGKILDLKSG